MYARYLIATTLTLVLHTAVGLAQPLPTASVSNVSAPEGNPWVPKTMSFPVKLSAPSTQTIRVSLTPVQITPFGQTAATVGPGACGVLFDNNRDVGSGTLSVDIPPGKTTGVITFPICPDYVSEVAEKFQVQVARSLMTPGGPTQPLVTGQAFGTIVNDDGSLPRISIGDLAMTETDASFNTSMVVTLTVLVPNGNPVPGGLVTDTGVGVSTRDPATGVAAKNYSPASCGSSVGPGLTLRYDDFELPTSFVIPKGETTISVPIKICGDNAYEPTESIVVVLTPTGTNSIVDSIGDFEATLTIRNDDTLAVGRPSGP